MSKEESNSGITKQFILIKAGQYVQLFTEIFNKNV